MSLRDFIDTFIQHLNFKKKIGIVYCKVKAIPYLSENPKNRTVPYEESAGQQ